MFRPETMAWVLVLDLPNGNAARRIGGLRLALRLALDAQAAGATGIALAPGNSGLAPVLKDARLRVPMLDAVPDGTRVVRAPASFLVHRQLFKALAADAERPGTAMTRDLASEPFALDVPFGFEPIDVVDAKTAEDAERVLFRSLRKPQDGWTSRYLNRYVSLAISRWLVKTPLQPNQVSVAILAVGLFGAWLVSRGTYLTMLVGATLFQLQSILDGCDGEMSRVTHRGSLLGEWLDTVGDDLTNYGFFAGAAVGLHAASGNRLYLLAGAVTVLSGITASGIEYRYLAKIGSGDLLKYPISAGGDGPKGWFAAIQPLFKRDTFVFLTLVATALGLLGPMLVVFSLGGLGILVSVFAAEIRMARERKKGAESA